MTAHFLRSLTIPLVTALMMIASPSQAQLGAASVAQLATLHQSPESAGTLIYRGDTFAQHTPAGTALYRYERRVATTPTGLAAAHLTSDLAGHLLIVESARFSPAYKLQRIDVANQQCGYSGSVLVSEGGHHLEYQLDDKGKVSTASEDISDPAVSGATLFGFILKNWDLLKDGATIPVRMIVLKDKTTYGFDLRSEKQASGQVSFSVTPGSFLIRLAVAPLRVVFDASTRNAVRYEGRVPPMELVSGKLKDLDARVEYTSVATSYR